MQRKILVLVLSALMLVTAAAPALASPGTVMDIRAAILLAKQHFPETDEFTSFYSSIDDSDGRLIFHLHWQGKDGASRDQYDGLTVRVDGLLGVITSYSRDRNETGQTYAALPSLSKETAQSLAESFISRLVPMQFARMRLESVEEPGVTVSKRSWPYYYNFRYVHYHEGIPCTSNNITVQVNADSGEINYYYMNWTDYEFPAAAGVIGDAAARDAFIGHGLKLMYLRSYSFRSGQTAPFLAYVLEEGYQLQIDAFTGEIVTGPVIWYQSGDKAAPPRGEGGEDYSIYELREIELVEGLLNAAQAEAIVRAALDMPAELVLYRSTLYRDYQDEELRLWDLQWVHETPEYYVHANARVNAATGALLSYSFGEKEAYTDREAFKLTPEAAEAIARAFLAKVAPAEYADTRLSTEYKLDPADPLPHSYGFHFSRQHKGVPVQGDNLSVTVRHDGRITGYWMNWYRGEMPSAEGIMSSPAIAQSVYAAIGLDLEYVLRYEASLSSYKPSVPTIHLVYRPGLLNTYNFDPRTGGNLDWQGNPVAQQVTPSYGDVSGHWAAADIALLLRWNLLRLPGDSFRPDEQITLGDLLKMLADAAGWQDENVILPRAYAGFESTAYAGGLSFGLNRGLFDDKDIVDPNAPVNREIMAFYLAKMLGHGQTAALEGIWQAPFADIGSVSARYQGSVAIVYAEKIMGGDGSGNFLPGALTTRAQVAATLARMLRTR